jgi:hypothetical protein
LLNAAERTADLLGVEDLRDTLAFLDIPVSHNRIALLDLDSPFGTALWVEVMAH